MKLVLNLVILAFLNPTCTLAWDNLHFYRASFFFGEPRFERKGLSTLNARVGAGSTSTARDGCSRKVCLLDIFGPQVMFKLGENVPCKDLTKPHDLTLQLLEKEPARNCFGQFSFGGTFKTVELDLQFYQNITDGFFLEVYLPIRKLEIKDITCCDQSPECAPCPNKNTPIWQAFLNQFHDILNQYCLCLEGVDHTGIGDTSVILGWAANFEETEHLDFIDTMMQVGVLFPTGRKSNPNIIFDLPQGYNGHYGFPLNLSIAFGLYEWFTFGGHVMVLPFKKTCREIRMKTSTPQNGFIKLAKGCAEIDRGSIWQVGTYLKADHIIRNASLLVGYSYSNERSGTICPTDTCIFDPGIVNSDEMLRGWKMHTIHVLGEWDFLKECSFFGPRFGVFGNFIVGGQRIFNTHIGGGMVGIDLVWSY